MNCPTCQREIPSDARLCPYCGTRIISNTGKRHTNLGTISIILSILATIFWWVPILLISFNGHDFDDFALNWWLFLIFPTTVLSIALGSITYYETKDSYGLSGLTLGSAILIISIVFKIITPY